MRPSVEIFLLCYTHTSRNQLFRALNSYANSLRDFLRSRGIDVFITVNFRGRQIDRTNIRDAISTCVFDFPLFIGDRDLTNETVSFPTGFRLEPVTFNDVYHKIISKFPLSNPEFFERNLPSTLLTYFPFLSSVTQKIPELQRIAAKVQPRGTSSAVVPTELLQLAESMTRDILLLIDCAQLLLNRVERWQPSGGQPGEGHTLRKRDCDRLAASRLFNWMVFLRFAAGVDEIDQLRRQLAIWRASVVDRVGSIGMDTLPFSVSQCPYGPNSCVYCQAPLSHMQQCKVCGGPVSHSGLQMLFNGEKTDVGRLFDQWVDVVLSKRQQQHSWRRSSHGILSAPASLHSSPTLQPQPFPDPPHLQQQFPSSAHVSRSPPSSFGERPSFRHGAPPGLSGSPFSSTSGSSPFDPSDQSMTRERDSYQTLRSHFPHFTPTTSAESGLPPATGTHGSISSFPIGPSFVPHFDAPSVLPPPGIPVRQGGSFLGDAGFFGAPSAPPERAIFAPDLSVIFDGDSHDPLFRPLRSGSGGLPQHGSESSHERTHELDSFHQSPTFTQTSSGSVPISRASTPAGSDVEFPLGLGSPQDLHRPHPTKTDPLNASPSSSFIF